VTVRAPHAFHLPFDANGCGRARHRTGGEPSHAYRTVNPMKHFPWTKATISLLLPDREGVLTVNPRLVHTAFDDASRRDRGECFRAMGEAERAFGSREPGTDPE
jgi:hypothetical protein